MRHRAGVGRVKLHKVREIFCVSSFFFFYLSSALVKSEREVLVELTNLLEDVPPDMCAQRRLKSTCAPAQSHQILYRSHEGTSYPWLSKMRPVKILISLRECAG